MGHRHALWIVLPILLSLAWRLLAQSALPAARGDPQPRTCRRWIQVGSTHSPLRCLGDRPARVLAAAGLPLACILGDRLPTRLRTGDRIEVGPGHPARCKIARMPAPWIAILGLPVPINRADRAELASLPGVGPALAARILAWRQRHGSIRGPAELLEVRGLGPRLLARIAPRVNYD